MEAAMEDAKLPWTFQANSFIDGNTVLRYSLK
jgi:hypothetical protein